MNLSYIPPRLEVYRNPQKSTPLRISIEGEGEANLTVIFPTPVNYIYRGKMKRTNVFDKDLIINGHKEIVLSPFTVRETPHVFMLTCVVLISKEITRSFTIDTLIFWGDAE